MFKAGGHSIESDIFLNVNANVIRLSILMHHYPRNFPLQAVF
jgi:hypothetical protein